MKPAFNLDTWWWDDNFGPNTRKPIPSWWMNFVKEYPDSKNWYKVLKSHAKYRVKNNGTIRLVFHGPNELSFFMLRYS